MNSKLVYAHGYKPNIQLIENEEQRNYVEKHRFYNSRNGSTRVWNNFDSIKTGLVGETVLCDYLGLPRPIIGKVGDKGYDLDYSGLKIDVKTILYNGPSPRLMLTEGHLNKPADNYMLLRYSGDSFEIMGIITNSGFKANMKQLYHNKGDFISYYCGAHQLERFN